MLIQKSRFTDARQLTEPLVKDPSLRTGDALMAHLDEVVFDVDRTAGLLACWAEFAAAALGDPASTFTGLPDTDPAWVQAGLVLAEAARQGDPSEIEDTARHCAATLDPVGRAGLLGLWGRDLIPSLVQQAGGLEELLEQASLHQTCAGNEEAGWVTAAAWVVCALTGADDGTEGFARIDRLVQVEGRGTDLWRVWSRVAASMMSTAYLREMEGFPHGDPDYPDGLALRAVEAVHTGDAQLDKILAEFAAQPTDTQAMLAFELAMLIAACRNLPSRRAARRAARGERDTDGEALSAEVGALMDKLPAHIVERTGRMYALARRAVLALIDGDADTLAAVVDRIGSWDDDPGRDPYPDPPFKYPASEALSLANEFFRLGELVGVHTSNYAAADGATRLIKQCAPAGHREAALSLLSTMKADGHGGVEFDRAAADGPAGLLAFAATAASLTENRRVFRSKETVRLTLIKHIRESEAKALRIPDRESISEISDQDALAFLHQLYGDDYPLPRDPDERAVWELDIVAVIKQHLLDTPADATTPGQRRALHERLTTILQAAAGTPRRTPQPPDRSGVVRVQPKKASKRKRKGK
ncbi:hypothetical protein AB0F71_02495 [Kitasatospora sp. NPDC028055]|uniref:hypothetical protein n=1 Tax=Kitasatospora sp. NPDC028055 TaxID=3155653 RepID=UPI0033DA6F03